MSEVYSRIEHLCARKKVDITTMCREAGVGRAILSELKMGRTKKLSTATLQKMADYFNVSVDYLLTGEDSAADATERVVAALAHDEASAAELRAAFGDVLEQNAQGTAEYTRSIIEVVTQHKQKAPPAEAEGELSIEERADQILSGLSGRSGETLMLDGKPASPEAVDAFRNAIIVGVELARKVNKDKEGR